MAIDKAWAKFYKNKTSLHVIKYYLTQWTDKRMLDKRGTDNRGSTAFKCIGCNVSSLYDCATAADHDKAI